MTDMDNVINDLNVAKLILCTPQMVTPEMGVRIGRVITSAIDLLKNQEPHKKGYWKYPQNLDCCCSECGNQPDHEPGESVPLYNYCPYCGAEMAVKWDG